MSTRHPRRILVCITGLTPQVVTETVFALAHQQPAWIPTEVHVLTTLTGARHAELMLLAEDRAQFRRLREDYQLPAIAFDASHVHVLHDGNGVPLDDIRNQADNMAMADAILAKIAEFAADPNAALHVSLAGGRKSMGFFAGYALSLYGRIQDRLSHVLVSPGFETHPEFFFPPREPRVLITRSNEPLSTMDAQIDLADIPFVRLRDRLPSELLPGASFAAAIEAAQRMQAPPHLIIQPAIRSAVCADGVRIPLSPIDFPVYAWHAERVRSLAEPAVALAEFNAIASSLRRELRDFGCRMYPSAMSAEREQWDSRPWNDDHENHAQWLSERRTRINKVIARQLGEQGVITYGIHNHRLKGRQSAHQLALPAGNIEFQQ